MKNINLAVLLCLLTSTVWAQKSKSDNMLMLNKEVVKAYVESFNTKKGPASLIADDIVFSMEDETQGTVRGRGTYLEGAAEFQGMIRRAAIDDIVAEGSKVVIKATYDLLLPTGHTHILKTMEYFELKNAKITHQYFMLDTSAFYKFMAHMSSESTDQ